MTADRLTDLLTEAAMEPIEDMDDDRLPDLARTAEDIAARLDHRWAELFGRSS